MNGWFHLGVYLGIPRPILDQIHAKHVASLDATEKCKIDMLSTWRENSDNCTWSALVSALHQTGRTGMARRIAAKHGKDFLIAALIFTLCIIIGWELGLSLQFVRCHTSMYCLHM